MNHHKLNSLSSEELFDQATEDASIYLWAVSAWPDPPLGYSRGYVLTLALAHRARTRTALSIIQDNASGQTASYVQALKNLWTLAEDVLAAQVSQSHALLAEVAGNELAGRADKLENALARVQRLSHDASLFEDTDTSIDIREAAHEFVLRFQNLDHAAREFSIAPLSGIDCRAFASKVEAIDLNFAGSFGIFDIIKDIMPVISAREYGLGRWWFDTIPEPDLALESAVSDQTMAAFSETTALMAGKEVFDDSVAHDAIAYALGELSSTQSQDVLGRLAAVSPAMSLAQDVREAEAQARTAKGQVPVLPALLRTIDPAPRPAETIRDFFVAVRRTLSPIFSTKLVAAAVVASLAFFIIINMPVNENTAPEQSPAQIASAPATLISPLGSLSVTARKDDRFLRRVSSLGPWGPDIFEMERGWALDSGDSIKIKASTDKDSFVYILHLGSMGNVYTLFSGQVRAGQVLELPDMESWYRLDRHVGGEIVYLLASNKPVGDFEQRAAMLASGKDVKSLFPEMDVQAFAFTHQ